MLQLHITSVYCFPQGYMKIFYDDHINDYFLNYSDTFKSDSDYFSLSTSNVVQAPPQRPLLMCRLPHLTTCLCQHPAKRRTAFALPASGPTAPSTAPSMLAIPPLPTAMCPLVPPAISLRPQLESLQPLLGPSMSAAVSLSSLCHPTCCILLCKFRLLVLYTGCRVFCC